jgi:type III restriction enzyme
MLKEGWDVRNVTTIVGLRAYAAKSNILPEQTLGRGLRRMYFGSDERETVSVMGTPAFMEFVESIQSEGVTFERVPMGGGGGRERQDSLVVEVDKESTDKDIDALDIALPRLTRRFNREFKDLAELDPRRSATPNCRSSPSRRKRPAKSSSRPCWIPRSITRSSSTATARRLPLRRGFFARQLLKDCAWSAATTSSIRRSRRSCAITCSPARSIWKIR